MAGMMQKAKQMQEDMEAVQKEIKLLRCEGDAASGAVKVEMNGDYWMQRRTLALTTCERFSRMRSTLQLKIYTKFTSLMRYICFQKVALMHF